MNSAEAAIRHEDDEVTLFPLPGNRRDDVVQRGGISGPLPGALEIGHELLRRKTLPFRQVRAKYGRDNDLVGGTERPCEILLKDAPAGRSRPRFEDRPNTPVRVRGAQA